MPKIPRVSEKQRVSQGTPVAAVSPGKERLLGNAISDFGSVVAKAGQSAIKYNAAKRRILEAQFKARANTEANLISQRSKKAALANPDTEPDGSSLQSDFDDGFNEYRDFVDSVGDPGLKEIAINEGNKVRVGYLGQLNEASISMHNTSVLKEQDVIKNKMSLRVRNNPSELIPTLAEYDETIPVLPYLKGDNAKIQREGKKDIILGAIEGLTEQGQFDILEKGLNSPEIAPFLTGKERAGLLKRVEAEKEEFGNQKYRHQQRRDAQIKREKNLQQDNALQEIIELSLNAKTPEDFRAITARRRQLFKSGQIDSKTFAATDKMDNVLSEDSANTRSRFLARHIEGAPMSQLLPEMKRELGVPGGLNGRDFLALMNDIKNVEKNEEANPVFKRQMADAKASIKARFTPSQKMADGTYIFKSEQKRVMSDISVRMNQLLADGTTKNPVEAEQIASAEILRRDSIVDIPGIPAKDQKSVDSLQEAFIRIGKQFKAQENVDPSVKRQVMRSMSLIKKKITALKAQEQADRIFGKAK